LISKWDPPFRFIDEQLRGPYRKWVHTHTFRDCAGGTQMTDHVSYELPLGLVGALAHPLIRRNLRKIFTHRNHVIENFLDIPKSSGTIRGPVLFG
ncbi:MAG: SRPBCC family protein, partial [Puniceicoccales bacterium]